MKQVIFKKTRTTRQLYKQQPSVSGKGTISVRDGDEEIFFQTSLDWDELNEMARKAAGNKSEKSHDGPVIVKVVERRRLA